MKRTPAYAYIRRIRNPAKRAYAEAYLKAMVYHDSTPPEVPPGLSYLAAQAVRIRLEQSDGRQPLPMAEGMGRGGVSMTAKTARHRIFIVFCDRCYSWQREKTSERDAAREATSHMNLYGHDTHILVKEKAPRLADGRDVAPAFNVPPYGSES